MYLLNIKIKFFIFLVFIYNLFEYIIQSLLLILSNLAFDRIYFFMHKKTPYLPNFVLYLTQVFLL